MIDFYFNRFLKLEDILADENIEITKEEEDGTMWVSLVNEEHTALHLYNDMEGYIWHADGHDAALPVVFYLYDDQGIKFQNDIQFFNEIIDICDEHDFKLTQEEWNTVVDSLCLCSMTGYIMPYGPIFTKLMNEREECDTKRKEIFDRFGIQKILNEREEEYRRIEEERKKQEPPTSMDSKPFDWLPF